MRLVEEGTAAATLSVADDAEMQIVIEHDPARIAPEMAAALLAQVVRLLDEMAKAHAATPLGKVDMLSTSETATIRATSCCQVPGRS